MWKSKVSRRRLPTPVYFGCALLSSVMPQSAISVSALNGLSRQVWKSKVSDSSAIAHACLFRFCIVIIPQSVGFESDQSYSPFQFQCQHRSLFPKIPTRSSQSSRIPGVKGKGKSSAVGSVFTSVQRCYYYATRCIINVGFES